MTASRALLLVTALAAICVPSLDTGRRTPGTGTDSSSTAPQPAVSRALRIAASARSTPAASPRPADPGWLARVEKALAKKEYEASWNGSGLQAPNRMHDLRTYFEPTGIRMVDRTAEGSPMLLSIRVSDWGRAGRVMPVGPGAVTSAANRVEIRRPGFTEWYENSTAGLEQGFTLEAPPAGEGALVLELSLGEARMCAEGGALVLTSPTGRRLRYDGLAAYDANGTSLPARLEPGEPGIVRISVEDAGARYPLTVDPMLTASGTLQADQAGASLGISVAAAGDVNGDGYGDVIVGASSYDMGFADEGAAFVFLGSAAGVASGNPATAATVLHSNQASAFLGFSVAGAGDVNGDGYADVLVGAPYYHVALASEGAAFLFLGSASGVPNGTPATAASMVRGNQATAFLGMYVAGAGDVNGDGHADVIVGASNYDSGETDEGVAFVLAGSEDGFTSGPPEFAMAVLQSNQANAFMGPVAAAGDVNGDGYGDVIVGAPYYSAGEANEGAAFVFLGSPTGIANGNPSTAAATLQSNQFGARLAISVAGAGDVNGDGYADVIVGADYYGAGAGAAFVFLGGASGVANGNPATAAATLQSNQANAHLGTCVAGAGDVNGDGYADVIVGAANYDAGEADEGAAFLFVGSASGVTSGDPSAAVATIQSNQASAALGGSVAGAGDVNGDGYADVIVGARYYDAGQADEGAAFVQLGGPAGVPSGNPATASTTFQSDQATAYLGMSVAGAGDVNRDGYADVIVGAHFYDAGQADEGAVFIFLGSATGVANGNPATAATMLQGNQASAYFGYSVASAGDVNGDGFADVIVGAPNYDAGQTDEGAAFVFLGSAIGVLSGGPDFAIATLQSDQANAYLGISVAGAGDVNGDGYADVIVGAYQYDSGETDEGAAFLFLGSETGTASGTPATAATTLQANQAGAQLGASVAGAGDVNGDGYADVIVGAQSYDSGEANEGAAFIFQGGAAGVPSGNPATAATILQSNQASAHLGTSVDASGDVDGDSYADVIVGAQDYDSGQPDEGAAFVFHGGPAGVPSGNPATAAATIQSDQASGGLGEAVAGAGDVNGDGYADVIVAAPFYDAGQADEGAAFLYLGGPSGIASGNPATAAATLQSDQASARFGWSVAGAGDVNGDGFADVIVGAPYYGGGQYSEGAAFIYLGGGGATGRPVLAMQARGDGSRLPVQPWGGSRADGTITLGMRATDPGGRGRVKFEAEYCPPGAPFGDASCGRHVSPSWRDVTATAQGVVLQDEIASLASSTLYRWRVRTLRAPFGVDQPFIAAPPNPAHGPWRRLSGQAVEADLRTGPPAVAVQPSAPSSSFAIESIRPNPAASEFVVSFVLPAQGRAKLELFDVAGRRVLARDLALPHGGQRTLSLGERGTLAAGIYLVRLSQAGRAASARVVVLH